MNQRPDTTTFWKIFFALLLLVGSINMCCRGVRAEAYKERPPADTGYYYVCMEYEEEPEGIGQIPPPRPEEYYPWLKYME